MCGGGALHQMRAGKQAAKPLQRKVGAVGKGKVAQPDGCGRGQHGAPPSVDGRVADVETLGQPLLRRHGHYADCGLPARSHGLGREAVAAVGLCR